MTKTKTDVVTTFTTSKDVLLLTTMDGWMDVCSLEIYGTYPEMILLAKGRVHTKLVIAPNKTQLSHRMDDFMQLLDIGLKGSFVFFTNDVSFSRILRSYFVC